MSDSDRSTAERVKQLETLDRLAQKFGQSLSAAFNQNLNAGRQLDGLLGTLATKLAGVAAKAALDPLKAGVKGLVDTLLSSSAPSAANPTAFARGGVLDGLGRAGPRVRPFAAGGIVAAPTYFPMGGDLGLMGEAGPEAILPLRRAQRRPPRRRRGRGRAPVAVTVNIATPDIEGFRRSEAQVAARLARAVARGRRAL